MGLPIEFLPERAGKTWQLMPQLKEVEHGAGFASRDQGETPWGVRTGAAGEEQQEPG